MNGNQNNDGENGRGFHVRKEPLKEGITDEEIASLCELRKIAGAVECRREDDFLVTKWPIF